MGEKSLKKKDFFARDGMCFHLLILGEAQLMDYHQSSGSIYHTLSIWLEMEFTSDIFLKTSVCADYSQTIFKNK